MTQQQAAAYIFAQAMCAQAEIAGMQAVNAQYVARGEEPPRSEAEFTAMIDRYGISHNAVLRLFEEATP